MYQIEGFKLTGQSTEFKVIAASRKESHMFLGFSGITETPMSRGTSTVAKIQCNAWY